MNYFESDSLCEISNLFHRPECVIDLAEKMVKNRCEMRQMIEICQRFDMNHNNTLINRDEYQFIKMLVNRSFN